MTRAKELEIYYKARVLELENQRRFYLSLLIALVKKSGGKIEIPLIEHANVGYEDYLNIGSNMMNDDILLTIDSR